MDVINLFLNVVLIVDEMIMEFLFPAPERIDWRSDIARKDHFDAADRVGAADKVIAEDLLIFRDSIFRSIPNDEAAIFFFDHGLGERESFADKIMIEEGKPFSSNAAKKDPLS